MVIINDADSYSIYFSATTGAPALPSGPRLPPSTTISSSSTTTMIARRPHIVYTSPTTTTTSLPSVIRPYNNPVTRPPPNKNYNTNTNVESTKRKSKSSQAMYFCYFKQLAIEKFHGSRKNDF